MTEGEIKRFQGLSLSRFATAPSSEGAFVKESAIIHFSLFIIHFPSQVPPFEVNFFVKYNCEVGKTVLLDIAPKRRGRRL